MSSAAVDALIEERIESFKNELSRIVHTAVEDALEEYRQTLRPLGSESRTGAVVRPSAPRRSEDGVWSDGLAANRSEPPRFQQQELALTPASGPRELTPADHPRGAKPVVDPFWSEAAAAISSPAEVRPGGSRTSAARRSPRELEAVGQRVLEHLRDQDGETVLGLARALGQPTSELRRPVQLLLAAGAIEKRSSTQGERFFAA